MSRTLCHSLFLVYAYFTRPRDETFHPLLTLSLSSGDDCGSDEEEVAYAYDRWGWGSIFCNGYRYCCKKSKPIPFSKCHWVGQGDCADNTCSKSEVTLWTNERGDSYTGCNCKFLSNAHMRKVGPYHMKPSFATIRQPSKADMTAQGIAKRHFAAHRMRTPFAK